MLSGASRHCNQAGGVSKIRSAALTPCRYLHLRRSCLPTRRPWYIHLCRRMGTRNGTGSTSQNPCRYWLGTLVRVFYPVGTAPPGSPLSTINSQLPVPSIHQSINPPTPPVPPPATCHLPGHFPGRLRSATVGCGRLRKVLEGDPTPPSSSSFSYPPAARRAGLRRSEAKAEVRPRRITFYVSPESFRGSRL